MFPKLQSRRREALLAKPILRKFLGPSEQAVLWMILFLVGASGVHIGCCLNPFFPSNASWLSPGRSTRSVACCIEPIN